MPKRKAKNKTRGTRKTPFSGKAKKAQLKAARERRAARNLSEEASTSHYGRSVTEGETKDSKVDCKSNVHEIRRILGQSRQDIDGSDLGSYLVKENDEAVQSRKRRGYEPLLNCANQDTHMTTSERRWIDPPRRPPGDLNISEAMLDSREQKYFEEYLASSRKLVENSSDLFLCPFEHNIEVWRQLWRANERANVIILVVDIRHPNFHIPLPFLSEADRVKKPVILLLTKIDLVPKNVLLAWKSCLRMLPGVSAVVPFVVPNRSLLGNERKLANAIAAVEIFQLCFEVHIKNNTNTFVSDTTTDGINCSKQNVSINIGGTPEANALHIALIGQPSVGKSSVLNILVGSKVAGVSRTPGKTKHLQSMVIKSQALPNDVVLWDCPGLLFPAIGNNIDNTRHTLELCGVLPLAQIREPYSVVRWAYESAGCDLINLYNLGSMRQQLGMDSDEAWSPFSILEALATKRGWYLSRGGRADVHRAGLSVVKDLVDGVIPWCMWPKSKVDDGKINTSDSNSNKTIDDGNIATSNNDSGDGGIYKEDDATSNNDSGDGGIYKEDDATFLVPGGGLSIFSELSVEDTESESEA